MSKYPAVGNAQRYAGQAARAMLAGASIARRSTGAAVRSAARDAARLSSYTAPTNVLSAADVGATATISIAAHTRVYGSLGVADVAIDAGTITGLDFATQYSVYYDDETLADTTPAFVAVETATNHADAQPGAAAGRHFVGVVTTPADGAVGTSGSGGYPPGGGGGNPIP